MADPIADEAIAASPLPTPKMLSRRQNVFFQLVRFAAIHGEDETELAIAAVLTGLATGPFRSQSPQWRELTATVVRAATHHMVDAGRPHAPSGC